MIVPFVRQWFEKAVAALIMFPDILTRDIRESDTRERRVLAILMELCVFLRKHDAAQVKLLTDKDYQFKKDGDDPDEDSHPTFPFAHLS